VAIRWSPAFQAKRIDRANVPLTLAATRDRPLLEAFLRRPSAPLRVDAAFAGSYSPSRYTDGSHPAFYAARDATTAVTEKLHHDARWLRRHGFGPRSHAVELLRVTIAASVADARPLAAADSSFNDPDDYAVCQAFARAQIAAGADGVCYTSIRDPQGDCVALFKRSTVRGAAVHKTVSYEWDGHAFI
jgi:hypothetical protein